MTLVGSASNAPLSRKYTQLAKRQALRPWVFAWRGKHDRELAYGADPYSSQALAVRADQLLRPRYRRRLASCLEHLVAEFDANRRWWFSAAIPCLRDQVAEARETLLALAGALRDVQPIHARGVALAARLLTDPDSPLYARTARGALHLKARAALEYLLDGSHPWCELPEAPPLPTTEDHDDLR